MPVKPVPEGYHSVTPYLYCRNAAKAIDFYKQAFGAQEVLRWGPPGGPIYHAEIRIGDSHVMLADEFPERGVVGPQTTGNTSVGLLIYCRDVDKMATQATTAGAKFERPVEDQFYGDRMGVVVDPFGHRWMIATHVEDVSEDEMKRRAAAQAGKQSAA